MKIDLHIHSNNSDGLLSVEELLNKAQNECLDIISFTDHDNCDSYNQLENIDVSKIYAGRIIKGIEISTSFYGRKIELLAYKFSDYKVLNKFFINHYASFDDEFLIFERKRILNLLSDLNIRYDDFYSKNLLIKRYEANLYQSILSSNNVSYLIKVLGSDYCEVSKDFFRKCILNPESIFYINFTKFYPSLEDVINLIHKHNGLLFLAHPFRYQIVDLNDTLEKLYTEYDIDGIECYYNTFNQEQVNYLIEFASKHNLFLSGGSDFHGTEDNKLYFGKYSNGSKDIPVEPFIKWID